MMYFVMQGNRKGRQYCASVCKQVDTNVCNSDCDCVHAVARGCSCERRFLKASVRSIIITCCVFMLRRPHPFVEPCILQHLLMSFDVTDQSLRAPKFYASRKYLHLMLPIRLVVGVVNVDFALVTIREESFLHCDISINIRNTGEKKTYHSKAQSRLLRYRSTHYASRSPQPDPPSAR
jgi:hypothetical protein